MQRRMLWSVVVFTCLLVGAASWLTQAEAATTEDQLLIVSDGEARAVIVQGPDTPLRTRQGANTLVEYVRKATGVRLSITTLAAYQRNPANFADMTRIFIGVSAPEHEGHIDQALGTLHPDGFVIHAGQGAISIVGPTIWGTLYGVYDFLERYVDVRWLMLGSYGEDVPTASVLAVPTGTVIEEPAFTLRMVSDFTGDPHNPFDSYPAENQWAHRNRLQGSYNAPITFQHNLFALLPPSEFGQTHPEFYPGGTPPAPGQTQRWQPCFTAEGIVDAAAQRIMEYFDANPGVMSYSLGVNDIGGYCEADPSHPEYPGKRNSLSLVDMSDIYYAWVNAVVEKVTEVHPDKWFGLLAYQEVMDPPSFPLHPRVVPMITKDRMTWIDDGIRSAQHEQMEAWSEVARQVGWWDYMYGSLYYVPRFYPHLMAQNLQYAAERGVVGVFSEMQYNALDAPKAWLYAKLLWNPYQDVDRLLDEWYERSVGPDAAPYLAAFYELWESFWTERIKESGWFATGKGLTYLPFTHPDYLDLVTPRDIERSLELLKAVVAKAQTDAQLERALAIQSAFQFSAASALSYPGSRAQAPRDAGAAIEHFTRLSKGYGERLRWAEKRYELIDGLRLDADPNLKLRASDAMWNYWWSDWTGWNGAELQVFVDYLQANEPNGGPVTDFVYRMVQSTDPDARRLATFTMLLVGAHVETESITANSSFEAGTVGWQLKTGDVGAVRGVDGVAHTGKASLLLDGVDRAEVSQEIHPGAGLTGVQVWYRVEEAAGGTIQLQLLGLDASGAVVVSYATAPTHLVRASTGWRALGLVDVLPKQWNRSHITSAEVKMTVVGAEGAKVCIDDFVVLQEVPQGVHVSRTESTPELVNVAYGKPTRESSIHDDGGFYPGHLAVDGITDQRMSCWVTSRAVSPPHWLEIDLSGTYELHYAEVWTGNEPGVPGFEARAFTLHYWDGSGWSEIPGAAVEGNSEQHVVLAFAAPVTTEKIRFYTEAADDGHIRLFEILVYGKPSKEVENDASAH